jgi:hypothetical protein
MTSSPALVACLISASFSSFSLAAFSAFSRFSFLSCFSLSFFSLSFFSLAALASWLSSSSEGASSTRVFFPSFPRPRLAERVALRLVPAVPPETRHHAWLDGRGHLERIVWILDKVLAADRHSESFRSLEW